MIVFDILLVSLKKKHNPQNLSGFMDDLGMVLQKAETINSLTPTFKKYEEATGAKLNFNKCFVLSTKSFKPVGPWAEMARSNYWIFTAQSLFAKVVFDQATRIAYFNMSCMISMGEGRAECVVYNLAHAIKLQLKRNLIKFLIRELSTRDKLVHFTNQDLSC